MNSPAFLFVSDNAFAKCKCVLRFLICNCCKMHTYQWCRTWGVQVYTQKFWFDENPDKSLKIWAKFLKIREKWRPRFAEKHMKIFFGVKYQKKSLWSQICRQSHTKRFRASVENSGKKPSHLPKFAKFAPTPVTHADNPKVERKTQDTWKDVVCTISTIGAFTIRKVVVELMVASCYLFGMSE